MSKKYHIAIIGAGVGGLATACRLAHCGYHVEVFEKLPECGGRAHLIEDRGFKFDTGPSFVLMPDFFREVYEFCGERLDDHLKLKVLDVNYKIFYPDGEALTVYRDLEKSAQELERIEKGSIPQYYAFLKYTGNIYKTVEPLLYQCFSLRSLLDIKNWALLGKLKPWLSYWELASRYFKSEKLRYAFTFEAMFMGVSPFKAPSFYSIITYTDHVQKIAHPMGGMAEIPKSLERLAVKKGARFYYNAEVTHVEPKNDQVSVTVNNEEKIFDKVVFNADYCHSRADVLKRNLPDYTYSCSVYLIYLGLKKKVKGLEHHNLFFAKDLRRNLREIFADNVTPDDPSFYIHVPTVTDPSLAPEGKDILYILIPVANLKNGPSDVPAKENAIRQLVFGKIREIIGEDVDPLIEAEHKFYPEDFITRYNIKCGATFGLAHNLMQSAFFRPVNFDQKSKNIFYVGASTQPGGGLPVVIAGSRIVTDLIK
ncbi:MAG: phytoene desaturase [Candidatus Omnitrophica bacterium]|nr:phytoene desaturase [Candidatus Omnitrophota bacterium]